MGEVSKKYEDHPNLITKWKNQLKEQSSSVFKEYGESAEGDKDKLIEQLYKTIGSLKMDVESLKGSQFTSADYAELLEGNSIAISMDAEAVPWTTSSSNAYGAA